jgi:histidyl-tRNA synthetase
MGKQQFLPLSGFRDLANTAKYELVARLREVFESFGFQSLETPALERQELLLGKLGAEAQKQLYLFEDNGGRRVGLRYDLTMSLSRYVAQNYGSLNFPFKRYEIGPVWRAEKAQAGRYRQFTQADVDIVGVESLQAEFELLELIAAAQDVVASLTVFVNDRRLINAVLQECKVPSDKLTTVLQALDKRLKISAAELSRELARAGLSPAQTRQLQTVFGEDCSLEDLDKLVGEENCRPVREIVDYGRSLGLDIQFQPSMVRGLEYYTGAVFEAVLCDAPVTSGAVLAGGRYDTLVEGLTGQKIPAVGISFGVDRLLDATTEFIREPEIFVAAFSETLAEARDWARQLRQKGQIVEVYPDPNADLGKQIKYADKKGYPSVFLPFEDEWRQGKVVRKDLATGAQKPIDRDRIGADE